MMEGLGLRFYFSQIPGNKGYYISCATPNWRIFLLYRLCMYVFVVVAFPLISTEGCPSVGPAAR